MPIPSLRFQRAALAFASEKLGDNSVYPLIANTRARIPHSAEPRKRDGNVIA